MADTLSDTRHPFEMESAVVSDHSIVVASAVADTAWRRSVLLAMELGFRVADLAMAAVAAWIAGMLPVSHGAVEAIEVWLPILTAFSTINLTFSIRGEYRDPLKHLSGFSLAHLFVTWLQAYSFSLVLLILLSEGLRSLLPVRYLPSLLGSAYADWLDPHKLALLFIVGIGLIAAGRVALIRVFTLPSLSRALHHRICIVGSSPDARRVAERIVAEDDPRIRLVCLIQDEAPAGADETGGPSPWPVLGSLDALTGLIHAGLVDQVLVAMPVGDPAHVEYIMRRLSRLPVSVGLISHQPPFPHRSIDLLSGLPIQRVCERELSDLSRVLKKLEDLSVAGLLFVVLMPLMLGIAVAVKLDSPGPVLFSQRRRGFANQVIRVHKFRTMFTHLTDADCMTQTVQKDLRVTRVGAFLRRYSLDELPQLLNVLTGEMSVVGPRPHAFSTKADGRLFEDALATYMARHRVKPGMTGWAQVNGWRGETDTLEKLGKRVEHDLYYIGNWSIPFDLLILFRTVGVALKGDNAY